MPNFEPRPLSGSSGTLTGATFEIMLPQLQGYFADVFTITVPVSGSHTMTVTDSRGDTLSTQTSTNQIINKYFVENLDKNRYNVFTISTVPASWEISYWITFHRITGDTRNDTNQR